MDAGEDYALSLVANLMRGGRVYSTTRDMTAAIVYNLQRQEAISKELAEQTKGLEALAVST